MTALAVEPQCSLRRVEDALREHGALVRPQPGGFVAQCPAHGDRSPSLSVTWAEGKTLLKCHTGCEFGDVVAALGLRMEDLWDEPPKKRDDTWQLRGRRPPVAAAARTAAAKPVNKPAKPDLGKPVGRWARVAEWVYVDVAGAPYGRVVRSERPCEHGVERRFAQQHWDAEAGKWAAGAPKPPVLYRLPEVLAAKEAGRSIYLAEGEKDADALVGAGVVATSHTNGAKGWKPLYAQTLAGAHVVIVVDRDKPGYDRGITIFDALDGVAATLQIVEPTVGNDARDHLEGGRAVAAMKDITRLLTMEAPATPAGVAGAAQPADGAASPVPEGEPDGEPDERGRHLRPVPDSGDDTDDGTGPGEGLGGGSDGGDGGAGSGGGQRDGLPNSRTVYRVRHGELVKVATKNDWVSYQVVLGCRAEIVRVEQRIASDEEAPVTTGYQLELTHPAHEGQVHRIRVNRKDWEMGAWLHDLPWANVDYDSGRSGLARVRDAIRMTSDQAAVVRLHSAPGWVELPESGWTYVHRGGGICAAGPVEVPTDFPDKLSRYELPDPLGDPGELRAAALHSFGLLDHLPARIGAPLAGLAYRSVITRMPPVVALQGGPGSYKSSMARVALHHVAPELRYDESVLSLSEIGSSPKFISKALWQFRDTLALADDAAPDKSRRAAGERLGAIIRTQYNGDSRDILDKESEMRAARPSRASLMTAAEVQPSATSAAERTLTVPFYKGQISVEDRKAVWEAESRRGRAGLTASFIRWIAGRREQVLRLLEERLSEYEAAWRQAGCSERAAEALAHIAAGWRFQLDHVVEAGAFTAEEAEELWERVWAGLAEADRTASDPDEPMDLAGRVLGLLRSVLLAPMAHTTLVDGSRPDAGIAQLLGWVHADRAPGDYDVLPGPGLRPVGKRIGAIKEVDGQRRLYLDPKLVLGALRQLTAQTGDTFEESTSTIAEALDQAGVLATKVEDGKLRRTLNRSMFGARPRVWDLDMDRIFGGDPEPEDGDPAGPGTPAPTAPPVSFPSPPPPGGAAASAAAAPIPPAAAGPACAACGRAGALIVDGHPRHAACTPPSGTASAGVSVSTLHQDGHMAGTFPQPHGAERMAHRQDHHTVGRLEVTQPCAGCGQQSAVTIDGVPLHLPCEGPTPDPCGWQPTTPAAAVSPDGRSDAASAATPAATSATVGEEPSPPQDRPDGIDLGAGSRADDPDHADPVDGAAATSSTPSAAAAAGRPAAGQGAGRGGRAGEPGGGRHQAEAGRDHGRTETTTEQRWRAPAAVVDATGVYLPGGEVVPLPDPLTHLGQLAELTGRLRLGWGGGKTMPETGHIFVTGALMLKFGLPRELVHPPEKFRISDEEKLLAQVAQEHRFVHGALADGWSLSQASRRQLGPWVRVWKDRQSAMISFLPLVKAAGMETLTGDDPSPAALAQRLLLYAQRVGIPFRVSNGATGIDLIGYLDIARRKVVTAPADPVPPSAKGAEARLIWHREPTGDERKLRFLHAYDANANYLSGARHTKLGVGPAEHRTGPAAAFDAKLPGYWLVHAEQWTDWRLPSPFNSLQPAGEGWRWLTTPTLQLVTDVFGIDVQAREAWVWPEHTQYLNKWAEQLDTARLDLLQAAGGDDDVASVLAAVKDVYRAGIGRLGYQGAVGKVFYRPDWHHLVIAQSQANLLRRLVKVTENTDGGHRWPLAIDVDNVLFASDDPNPITAIPAPMQIGVRLGQFKPKGSGLMAELGDRLGVGTAFDFRRLTPPGQWSPTSPGAPSNPSNPPAAVAEPAGNEA